MNDFLHLAERWSDVWSSSLWRASWQGAIAIALVWAVARWYTFLSPRVVCWAWRLVCLKLLLTLVWISPIEIPVLPPSAATVKNVTASPQPLNAARPIGEESPPVVAMSATAQADVAANRIDTRSPLTLAWLIGVCVFIMLTAREWVFTRRLCHSSHAPPDELLANLCRSEADRLTVRRLPRIRLARIDGPLLVGIWRPTIVLPQRALELFDESELRLMLGHELAHLKRRDLLWNWLPTVVGWLLFFDPLVLLLKRSWFESQEAACDELLIQKQVAPPAEYGRLLLKLSTLWPSVPRTTLAAAGVLGAYRNLERRIVAMTHVKSFAPRRLFVGAGAVLLITAPIIIPWRLVAQERSADNPAMQSRDAAAQNHDLNQSADNLRKIMSAIHTYHDLAGHLPPAKSGWGYDKSTKEWYRQRPHLSWRVLLLPLLGQAELFSKFKSDGPWHSEHNRKLIPLMPAIYHAPGSKAEAGKTNYLGISGPNAVFPDKETIGIIDITDGTVKTIMLAEVPDDAAVEWTRPEDFPADTKDPIRKLVGLRKGGFLTAFASGDLRFLSEDISPQMLQNLFCRNDGRAFNQADWERCIHDIPTATAESLAK